jgi:hypothetical protein
MKSAREIKEKYGSISKDVCEGYQDEQIIQAMEEYARGMALDKYTSDRNLKQSELIRKSYNLIGEIIDNYEADAINLPVEMYNDLKFHWKQLGKEI